MTQLEMPRDVVLYAAVLRIVEAYEITGWNPKVTRKCPHLLALYVPDQEALDFSEAIKQVAENPGQSYGSNRLTTLKSLKRHLEGKKPIARLQTIEVEGHKVHIATKLAAPNSWGYDLMNNLQQLAEMKILEQCGVKATFMVYPGQ